MIISPCGRPCAKQWRSTTGRMYIRVVARLFEGVDDVPQPAPFRVFTNRAFVAAASRMKGTSHNQRYHCRKRVLFPTDVCGKVIPPPIHRVIVSTCSQVHVDLSTLQRKHDMIALPTHTATAEI